MNLYCGCLLWCYLFSLFLFSTIRSHLSILCHFNSGKVDSRSLTMVPPGFCVLVCQFYLLLIKYHHSFSLHLLKRGDSSLSHCVICSRPEKNVSWWLPSTTLLLEDHQMVFGPCRKKLNRYKCVFWNLIDAFWRFLWRLHMPVYLFSFWEDRGGVSKF